jgi:hypothetical protein
MTRLAPIASALLLVWRGMDAATAASAEPAMLVMNSVEVVGVAPLRGLGVERGQLPYQVQTASATSIAVAAGQNISEFMARNLTGVNVNEISGSPFQNDITYRGFRASPVLGSSQGISVYLDGVRVNEPFADVVNWDMLPEAAISNVLLAPGSNPLYGLNTLGGALALSTKSGSSHPGGELGLSLTDSGQRRADLAYGYDSGAGWHAFAAGTAFHDQGWREQSNSGLGNLYAKLAGAAASNAWSVALLAGRSRLIGNGLLPDGLYASNRRAIYTAPDQTRNRLSQAVFKLTHHYSDNTALTAMLYARSSHRSTVNGDINDDYAEGESADPATWNTTATRQRSQGASVHLSRRAGAHQVETGASFDRSSVQFAQFEQEAGFAPDRSVIAGDAEREAGAAVSGHSRAAGLYATDTWSQSDATWLTLSARYNHARVSNQLRPDDATVRPQESFGYRHFNPALGLPYERDRPPRTRTLVAAGANLP